MDRSDGARPRARRAMAIALAWALVGAGACGDSTDDEGGEADEPAAGNEEPTGDDGDGGVLGPVDRAEGEPVRVGLVSDGSSASVDQSIELDVAAATVAYVNEHRGGMGGRPVELTTCETKLDPALATDCANQMVEAGVVAVLMGSSGVVENVWQPLHDAGVPTVFFAASAETMLTDDRSTFVLSNPDGATQLPLGVAEDEGADEVTAVVIDVPPAIEGLEAAVPTFADAGIELELVRVPLGTADMTPQMSEVVDDDPGVVHVLGNDAFCISAFQALQTVGYDGPLTAVTQCITDATRTGLPAGSLEGIVVGSPVPVGVDEGTELYRAVADTFGDGIDTSRITGAGAFVVVAGFVAGLEGIEGDVTSESVVAALRSMPETELPGAGGLRFRCDGESAAGAAVCTPGSLVTTLDAEGRPSSYEAVEPAAGG